MVAIGFSAVLAVLDLLVKERIEAQPRDTFPRVLPHTGEKIRLQQFHNKGFPFGVMQDKYEFVQMTGLAMTSAVAGILWYLSLRRGHHLEKLSFSLMLGGALSNLYDRLVRKYVVDYFTIETGLLKRVIFNLGDIFIFLGSSLYLLRQLIPDVPVLTRNGHVLYNGGKNKIKNKNRSVF